MASQSESIIFLFDFILKNWGKKKKRKYPLPGKKRATVARPNLHICPNQY
jgi:hypothetical protein